MSATNITLIYGGAPNESAALQFSALLAGGLDASAECRFTRDPLAALSPEHRAAYRNLMELGGWSQAHGYLSETAQERLATAGKEAEAAFRSAPASARLVWGEPLDLADEAEGELASIAFTRDLLVASLELGGGLLDSLVKRALIGAGAPLVLVARPPAVQQLADASVVVAWKPSAAAKHALRDALPVLRKAKRVHLVAIEEEGYPSMKPSVQQVGDYLLEAHNVSVDACVLRAADSPALQLADFYHEVGADLLVMGAYSMPRLRELLFGGFTKHFLSKRACNLLLAH
jgi:nucleotide-binding universal stress UspA family protein